MFSFLIWFYFFNGFCFFEDFKIWFDLLISKINEITNVNCLKLSNAEFVIISTVDDTENDLAYKDLAITGTLQDQYGLETLSKKSALSVKMRGVTYSVTKTFNGTYLKSLYLKRG